MKTVKFLITLIILVVFTGFSFSQESDLYQFLKSQPSIISVEEVGQDNYFNESYVIQVKQSEIIYKDISCPGKLKLSTIPKPCKSYNLSFRKLMNR